MEGMVAPEKESGMTQKQMPNAFSQEAPTGKRVEQWRAELDFLKNKYSLLKRLIELSRMHCRSNKQAKKGEDLLPECARLLSRVLPDFEKKYREGCDLLDCLEFLPEASSGELLAQMQYLQQDWRELQFSMQTLEIKLLRALVKRYPVVII